MMRAHMTHTPEKPDRLQAARSLEEGAGELEYGTRTSLVSSAPPPSAADMSPDQVEFYVRSAMHQDRSPGQLLVVMHPAKRFKVPRGLFAVLRDKGFGVTEVETQADRIASVTGIRDALLAASQLEGPLDLLVVSGDGSLDHHVLIAAYWAFFPDLVQRREGCIDVSGVSEADLASLPRDYRQTFFAQPVDCSSLDPSDATLIEIWLLRMRLESALRKGKAANKIAKKAKRAVDDPLLRVAILATLFPDKVCLRAHGFDLSALVAASQQQTFQGLYPYIRAIAAYPAGTAADNAVFAGVPGWGFASRAKILTRWRFLGWWRRRAERKLIAAFVRYFTSDSVVVPARVSFVGFDGAWQRISSHAAGGPGAGRFFAADFVSKTKGMLGYLMRIPSAIINEGVFGSTLVRLRALDTVGREKIFAEQHLVEGLYTNRTFIGGVGSVPTTDPTSFAGQSSLCILPTIWAMDKKGRRGLNLRGLGVFFEAIFKGVFARILHLSGFGVGRLAGGGKLFSLLPEQQVAIKEGEQIEIEYMHLNGQPRACTVHVSGDPFHAQRMSIRVAWGPIPLLADTHSLLLAATRRSLANVRVQKSFKLRGVYIGGDYHFHHHLGDEWDDEFSTLSGLLRPRLHLPRALPAAQKSMIDAWQKAGAGEFLDTTASGLSLWRRGRYAHNNDQSAHLIMVRDSGGSVLVRQVRLLPGEDKRVFENRSTYLLRGPSYIIQRSQTLAWLPGQHPQIVQEDHYFRDTEAFQLEAPSFFPVVAADPDDPTLLDAGDEEPGRVQAQGHSDDEKKS